MVGEESRWDQRLLRYGQVSTTMGGVAVRLAGEKIFGLSVDRKQQAKVLREALGKLKGPLMKVAQLLSTIPDVLPPEYIAELSQLQAHAPSMGWPFVRRRMEAELGKQWSQYFQSFETTASAAASLGQVHKAFTQDSKTVVCKLQYPNMQSAVEADLAQLSVVFSLFEYYDKAIRTKHIHDEISARLREELDYIHEAKNLAMFGDIHAKIEGVHVPEILSELSTERLLTMVWHNGIPLLDFVQQYPQYNNTLAMNMFYAWYVPFYHYGIIHGDPHLGNYTVRPDGSINLFDFGCVRIFHPSFVEGVLDLYRALQTNDTALAIHAYEKWGFKNISAQLIEVLNIWARFIYEPLLEDRVCKITETHSTVYGREAAFKVHTALRELGGIEIPRTFVFMDRAAIGLGGVFLRLKAQLNWYQIFHELIAHFNVNTLQHNQTQILQRYGLQNVDQTIP